MWKIAKIELFKLKKMNDVLLMVVLFLYPVMWSVLAFRNEIVLVNDGHSMVSWVLACLFILDKTFIILLVFVLLGNRIVMEEQKDGYVTMVKCRAVKTREIYLGKVLALIKYFSLICCTLIIVSGSCYFLFVKGNETMATGAFWNRNELLVGIKCLVAWALDKCIILPIYIVALGKRFSTTKTTVCLVGLNLMSRGLALFPGIAQFNFWNISKKMEKFVVLCQKDTKIVPTEIILTFFICGMVGLMFVMKEKHRRKCNG